MLKNEILKEQGKSTKIWCVKNKESQKALDLNILKNVNHQNVYN